MIEIIVALITAIGGVVAVVVTNSKSNKRAEHRIETAQAVTDTKLTELTREVREHNNFARRVPVLEEQIKVVNHRVADLEQDQRKGV